VVGVVMVGGRGSFFEEYNAAVATAPVAAPAAAITANVTFDMSAVVKDSLETERRLRSRRSR